MTPSPGLETTYSLNNELQRFYLIKFYWCFRLVNFGYLEMIGTMKTSKNFTKEIEYEKLDELLYSKCFYTISFSWFI
jgi:hypothetical protein